MRNLERRLAKLETVAAARGQLNQSRAALCERANAALVEGGQVKFDEFFRSLSELKRAELLSDIRERALRYLDDDESKLEAVEQSVDEWIIGGEKIPLEELLGGFCDTRDTTGDREPSRLSV